MRSEGSELPDAVLYNTLSDERSELQKLLGQDDIHCLRQLASLAAARRLMLFFTTH
jgi:hypothetical protein